MTDPNIPDVTDEDRRIARDWAELAHSYPDTWTDRLRAAARVILNDVPAPPTTPKENPEMPDQALDDQVRPIVAAMRAAMRRDEHTYSYGEFLGDMSDYIKALEALLPPRPTLADMTPEERAECRWMQADIIGGDEPLVITRIDRTDGTALILDRNGCLDGVPAEHVTPRPDLPRLQWPGDTPAPALPAGWRLADHPRYGRVFVTAPEPDGDGDLWFIDPSAAPGVMEDWCDPDVLTYIDTEPEANQ